MAVPKKLVMVPNAATQELWRIAERGAVGELASVLPQADINARNEHGMTALMRAAHYGRVQMVRALLEHGADPNVTRNDKFTALSLAAFFGYSQIVEMLVQHGANTDVPTRFQTSPRMWASARRFDEAAKCLEKPAEIKKSVSPPPAPAPVRTLKDPPEIWDLVHEAPRQFNPGSAFVARLGSMKRALVFGMTAVLFVASVATIAVLFMKDAPAPVSVSKQPEPIPTESVPVSVPSPAPVVVEPVRVSVEANNTVVRRSRSAPRSRSLPNQAPAPPAQASEVENDQTAAAPTVAAPKFHSQPVNAAAAANKNPAPASPQLISPAKSASPRAKVIQWP